MAGKSTKFIIEIEEQEAREDGERMEINLFSEPDTAPGNLHLLQSSQELFSVGTIIFIL